MDTFNKGRVIGYILADFIMPFLFMWLGVWIYEKIRQQKIKRWRRLKIFLGGLLIFILSLVMREANRYVVS